MVDMPDLNRLKMQAAARRITQNSRESARICQFEVPGGGECRDVDCGDLHLSQLEVEPNALQAARARRPEATFDERVKEAWASMRDRRVQVTLDNKS
ncbi:hypothetical protein B0F90DRAFT_1262810 [Multifurca ochricompacta]|uniref:Uncharacterized protein n=1 Tax=Multifurca ochricompacta TaxID=376703 RepID=A0AAD4M733_9AGAM|nr:hypothetical protein B0F90DRAFT_1262810 [Multifurca ochricompacta]